MAAEHIGVATGLADLANFLAAHKRRAAERGTEEGPIRIVLFGAKSSLPAGLQSEFTEVAVATFPELDVIVIPSQYVTRRGFDGEAFAHPYLRKTSARRIVYGNAIHQPLHRSLYAYLKPDEFVFFDNGLSSYSEHDADIAGDFAAIGAPFPSMACLSLVPALHAPGYLSSIPQVALGYDDYADIYARLRAAAPGLPSGGWLPGHVILGTSLFRTKRIEWGEERSIYLRLIKALKARTDERVAFKAHPRASDRPLITSDDGVEVLDTGLPVEALVRPGSKGCAYSISSTSLFTLKEYFGWSSFRMETAASRAVIDASPHLGMVNVFPPTPIDEI